MDGGHSGAVGTERIALFVGSFDPFTLGHADIVNRSLNLFDKLIVGIGVHPSKKPYFSPEKRLQQIRRLYEQESRLEVCTYTGLSIDLARLCHASHIIRGVRSLIDFEYEQNMAQVNRFLGGPDTVFLLCDPNLSHVSSSAVRELLSLNRDVTQFLPEGMDLTL